jgi:hypothetical protein
VCCLPLAVCLQLPDALFGLIQLLPGPVELPLQLSNLTLQAASLIACALGIV